MHSFKEGEPMNIRRMSAVLFCAVLSLPLLGRAEAVPAEIKGAAILDHPCGKVAVKFMGLVHEGKMDEATRLGTQAMQDEWKGMDADDRKRMSGMMKEMSSSEAQFSADIKKVGLLVIDGNNGTLTVKKPEAGGNGSHTQTQRYEIDGSTCLIAGRRRNP
jgi:hypothetical protein